MKRYVCIYIYMCVCMCICICIHIIHTYTGILLICICLHIPPSVVLYVPFPAKPPPGAAGFAAFPTHKLPVRPTTYTLNRSTSLLATTVPLFYRYLRSNFVNTTTCYLCTTTYKLLTEYMLHIYISATDNLFPYVLSM